MMQPLLTFEDQPSAITTLQLPPRFQKWRIPRYEGSLVTTKDILAATQFIGIQKTAILYAMVYADKPLNASLTIGCPAACCYFVLKGEHNIHIHDVGKCTLRAGQFLIFFHSLPIAQLHIPQAKDQVIFILQILQADLISALTLYPGLRTLKAQVGKNRFFTTEPVFMHASLFNAIERITNMPYTDEMQHIYADLFITTVHLALSHLQKHRTNVSRSPGIELAFKVKHIIDASALHDISVKDIVHKSGYDQNKLSSVFKSVFGITLGKYIRKFKLDNASKMLAETELPLKRIAEAAGYSNTGNFCQAFKNHYHITPLSLRKKSL